MTHAKRPRTRGLLAALVLPLFGLAVAGISLASASPVGAEPASSFPYKVLKSAKVGGEGGFDYVYADSVGRKLYIARSGPSARVTVFNLDTLAPAGEIPNTAAHGAATDAASHHGFASSSPVAMWDTNTLALIKTIPVQGRPDGILGDAFNHRIYVFSHEAPNVTVLDAAAGTVLGTIDLGGAPEEAASDGNGHLYIDIEDKDSVAVVDAKTMKVTGTYGLNGKGGGNAGLALDSKNHVLFVACRDPQNMVMLDADTGKYLADLPIGRGCDGAAFNPATGECLASFGDGTLIVIKETTPTTFAVEQTVPTMAGARTLGLDTKTGHAFVVSGLYGPAPAPPPAAATPPAAGGPPAGRRRNRAPMLPGSFTILEVGR